MAPLLAAIIMTNTSSYSSTGGNHAGPGGTVVQGPSYSSVTSENIDGGGSSGTATVHIETNTNGQISSQTITKTVPPGGSIEIVVATSSRDTGTNDVTVHAASAISTNSASVSLRSIQHAVHALLKVSASSSVSVNASTSAALETSASTTVHFNQIGFRTQLMLFFKQLFTIFGF